MSGVRRITRDVSDPRIVQSGPSSLSATDSLARALGWFSIGLGMTELLASRRLARAMGMDGKEAMIRAYGVREIASGVLSLSIEKNTGIWSRVAGDCIDLLTLAGANGDGNPKRRNVGIALALVSGVTILDLFAAQALTRGHSRPSQWRDYGDRSGFPKGIEAARGSAARGAKEAGTYRDYGAAA